MWNIHVQLCFHALFLKAQTHSNERDMWNTFGETICNVRLVFHGQLPSSRTFYLSVVNGVTVVKTNWIQLWAVCACKDLQLHWYILHSVVGRWPKCDAAHVAEEGALAASGLVQQGCLLIGSCHVCPWLRGEHNGFMLWLDCWKSNHNVWL